MKLKNTKLILISFTTVLLVNCAKSNNINTSLENKSIERVNEEVMQKEIKYNENVENKINKISELKIIKTEK